MPPSIGVEGAVAGRDEEIAFRSSITGAPPAIQIPPSEPLGVALKTLTCSSVEAS